MGAKLKLGAIILGAVVITALGIDAADTLQGNGGTLLGQLAGSEAGGCPAGMVEVPGETISCIDAYEVSAGRGCPVTAPSNQLETNQNFEAADCTAVSQRDVTPWRFISREQAAAMCARAGKRLPTALEWYQAALGHTNSSSCNVDTHSPAKTGAHESCQSPAGTFDQIGNVWEWVADDVIDGTLNQRALPPEGYVTQVDRAGVATETRVETPNSAFGEDYFWSESTGAFAMIRGGYYGSKADAGVYAVHAHTLPTMAGTAIGFRCVR